jgi:multidrug efflux pump subunit AcrB
MRRAGDPRLASLSAEKVTGFLLAIARAFAIMGGLLVATILTLVFLPTLYLTLFGGKEEEVSVT